MKISEVTLKNFMLFDEISMTFSPQINVIFGENSTGKTALMKALYTSSKIIADKNTTKLDDKKAFLNKIIGVYRPDKSSIGRLVYRQKTNATAEINVNFDDHNYLHCDFRSKQSSGLNLLLSRKNNGFTSVFIPPKEIISSTVVFPSLYEEYHIDFEETYYDLCKLLLRPFKKNFQSDEHSDLLSKVSKIIGGEIIQRDNCFFLKAHNNNNEFEMGLVSEGYRKLSTLICLLLSGSLDENSILFWDEPETNMNPKMIYYLANTLIELSKIGVQIFINTHSYFMQQAFNLISSYSREKEKPEIKFISLFKDQHENVRYECGDTLDDISHNAIMDEFDTIYDREQEMME